MKYALGSVLYYWTPENLSHFYEQARQSKADIIYLGETVCSKRLNMKPEDWLSIARELAKSDKQVILSTLGLIQASAEFVMIRKFIENGEFLIEAHDLGVIQILTEHKLPFVAGYGVNCYNAHALKILLKQGMVRWCMPVELSQQWLSNLLIQCEKLSIRHQFEVEVMAYGHLPLAYSARCFTARSENRSKDNCETCCINYPQGRKVYSQEQQQVFVLNGIQTQSGLRYNLINDLASMQDLVDVIRISPETQSSLAMLDAFQHNEKVPQHIQLDPKQECNGYWYSQAGLELMSDA